MSSNSSAAYDFDFSGLSIAPSSRRGGIGESSSVCSSLGSRLHAQPNRPWTSAVGGGGGSDALSVASTSMSNLARNGKAARSGSAGTIKKSPAEVAKHLESEVDKLIERTVVLRKEGKVEDALESAKEASKKEQLLRKHRRANNLSVNSEAELMYSTWFNLATAYEANDLPDEALKTYAYLAKQRGDPSFTGRLRINMGNIYYSEQRFPSAIKMYNMALDMMSKDDKSIAHKVRRNISNAFFRMGQIRDAVKNYEAAMAAAPDIQTGFNLLVCHLALGDSDKMREDFQTLVKITSHGDASMDGTDEAAHEVKRELDTRSKEANHFLMTAARLIAPLLDSQDWSAGYDWVCNVLDDRHEELAIQMKLEQATQLLKRKEFGVAIKMLKNLRKKGKYVAATATNLSFVNFLEGNVEKASEYADNALGSDRYNAKALVNKGNCLFVNGDFASAKDVYLEAIGVEVDCVQAIYNLGLVNAQLGLGEEAIHAFEKVHRITPNDPQILHQIADIYELQGRSQDALKWFNVLAARVPSDPTILTRLGQLYAENNDEAQGLHYQLESFRHLPLDLDSICWIGTWFAQQEMYERSCYFFQQAALVQPKEIKWGFMVASAHKRCGAHDIAFRVYEKLHDQFPESIDCLRYLVAECKAVGKSSYQFENRLDRLLREEESKVH